jgi:hypothetical protein
VVNALLKDLKSEFALKDLGNLYYFLGIQVWKEGDTIAPSQYKYLVDLLERAGMKNCKSLATPLSTSEKLSLQGGERLVGIFCSTKELDLALGSTNKR